MGLFSRGAAVDPENIELDEFAKGVHSGEIVVVDVREPHEYAAGHVPGALPMPLSSFDPRDLPPASGKPVVLICQAGGRSRTAMLKAHGAGRPDVRHFAGGTGGWRQAGGDIEI